MANLKTWLRGMFGSEVEPTPDISLQHPRTRHGWSDSYVADDNDFALALYGKLRQKPGNLCFSPFSIRTALAMTYAGARGDTAEQISKALRFSSPDETLHVDFAEIIQRLNAAGGGKYEMAVANSLWGQDGSPILAGFLDVVIRHYGGDANLVDFRGNAEVARVTINQWVEHKTRQKIRELISSGSLNADTRLVLVNAVYFKGMWVLPFRKAATRDEPFYLEGGGTVQVPLMHQSEEVKYLEARGYQVVVLDYHGGDLSMLVFLPDEKDGLRDLETRLSARMLHECVANIDVREVKLFLPRYKITWGAVDMQDQLTSLGMTRAFSRSQADFSGINGYEPPHEEALFISAVVHKAFVEVNEEGTEAAAATIGTVSMAGYSPNSSPPPVPIFRADHPFLFAIRDRKSGAILFLGRVVDPTRES